MFIQYTENISKDIKDKHKHIPFFESNDFWYNRIDQNPSDIQVIFNGHFPYNKHIKIVIKIFYDIINIEIERKSIDYINLVHIEFLQIE
jgi:hypothetical protein